MHRILLAEDDNDMRRFLVKALEKAGYHVTDFDNGASAYERLREEPFSLLLTDIVMPEMDGIELARRATELDPDLKVMFITGFAAVALRASTCLLGWGWVALGRKASKLIKKRSQIPHLARLG